MKTLKINLDFDTGNLIQLLATTCGINESDVIDKILSGHLSELWELRAFMEQCVGDPSTLDQAVNLLVSYGPESLMAGIKRIAPDYVTLGARLAQDIDSPQPLLQTTH